MKALCRIILVQIFFVSILSGCAGDGNKKLDDKIEKEMSQTPAMRPSDIRAKINSDARLDADQKEKLYELQGIASEELGRLRNQERQLKKILFTDFSQENRSEMSLIRERLIQNGERQVAVLFELIDSADGVVGHNRHEMWFDLD